MFEGRRNARQVKSDVLFLGTTISWWRRPLTNRLLKKANRPLINADERR
jgi:hypothetical protein